MSSLEVQYRGYAIRFSENSEEWTCYDIDYIHASLGAVKRKIDLLDRAQRHKAAIPVLVLVTSGWGGVKDWDEATIVEVVTTRHRITEGHSKVAIVRENGDGRKVRRTTTTEQLIQDTPENRQKLTSLCKRYSDLSRQQNEVLKQIEALPRLTEKDVARLIGLKLEEGQ